MKNANKIRQRHDYEKELHAYEEQKKQEMEMLEQMSEEERQKYKTDKEKQLNAALALLTIGATLGKDYSGGKGK